MTKTATKKATPVPMRRASHHLLSEFSHLPTQLWLQVANEKEEKKRKKKEEKKRKKNELTKKRKEKILLTSKINQNNQLNENEDRRSCEGNILMAHAWIGRKKEEKKKSRVKDIPKSRDKKRAYGIRVEEAVGNEKHGHNEAAENQELRSPPPAKQVIIVI